MSDIFRQFSNKTSQAAGSAKSFVLAVTIIAVWAVSGPFFDFSNTWQLIINTGTTIVTFLMVFLIQNTQNRDSRAMHLKLDELLMSSKGARSALVDIEEIADEELEALHNEFHALHEKAEAAMKVRGLTLGEVTDDILKRPITFAKNKKS